MLSKAAYMSRAHPFICGILLLTLVLGPSLLSIAFMQALSSRIKMMKLLIDASAAEQSRIAAHLSFTKGANLKNSRLESQREMSHITKMETLSSFQASQSKKHIEDIQKTTEKLELATAALRIKVQNVTQQLHKAQNAVSRYKDGSRTTKLLPINPVASNPRVSTDETLRVVTEEIAGLQQRLTQGHYELQQTKLEIRRFNDSDRRSRRQIETLIERDTKQHNELLASLSSIEASIQGNKTLHEERVQNFTRRIEKARATLSKYGWNNKTKAVNNTTLTETTLIKTSSTNDLTIDSRVKYDKFDNPVYPTLL